ncbi:hypothetical protein V8F20_001325 [Naviculisporaceae sp. PSN 640]
MASILTAWLFVTLLGWELVLGAPQPPRRVGMQAFRLMDTLWINGGRFLHENGSVALDIESKLESYNLTLDFDIPNGPVPMDPPPIEKTTAPAVYHGFAFSNLVDRAWLFGGAPVDPNARPLANHVWRFEPGAAVPWLQLPLVSRDNNLNLGRPYRGAGCNVPDLQRGFYLGGMVDNEQPGFPPRYSHWLYEFSMDDETLNVLPVPSFVPVVNQSMVFVNTGTRQGALVVLGGSVESNGSLSPSPLTSVFIFDIESRIWIQQPVTGLEGNLKQDGTVDVEAPDGGIPRTRVSGCAAVGSAQDKTSHSIFYLGGVNETISLADIWVLILPSAVWIKALPVESASNPKYENSCFLANDRFIWMFGGCFRDPKGPTPCVGYSYNPLVYDIAELRIQHYMYSRNGFLVHENITDVIGGRPDGTGGASIRSPIHTNFSDPILNALFDPPHSDRPSGDVPFFSDKRLLVYVPAFLSPLLGLAIITSLVTIVTTLSRKYPLLRNCRGLRVPSHKCWRPAVFSISFLALLNIVPIFLIALLFKLKCISGLSDTNAEHWSGGLDSDGVWTGNRQGTDGNLDQKNSTQRIGDGNYWAFSYLPTLVIILYGRLWKVLDDEVKRIDKYIQLRRPEGERLRDSLFLEYHSFWVPLSILQAFRRKRWYVVISSLGLTLGSIVAPIVQNYTLSWTLYSGAHLSWPDTYSWLVAIVDPEWALVLVVILVSSLTCSFALLVRLPFVETGLQEDPRGLESILYLVPENFPELERSSNKKKLSELEEEIGDLHVRLVTAPGNPTPDLEITAAPAPQTTLAGYLTDYPLSFPFRRWNLALWTAFLLVILILSGIVATGLNQNARDRLWNYTITVPPDLYLILAIFAQSIADVFDFSIRALYPYYELRRGGRSPDVLFVDYVASLSTWGALSTVPVIDIIAAWWRGHSLIYASALASMAITTVTVFLGSLQLSSSYYGATSFVSDQTAATGAACLTGFTLIVYASVGFRIHRVLGKSLKRPVETFMGAAPYLVFSEKLRADLQLVAGLPGGRPARLKELNGLGRKYALGTWNKGPANEVMLGVERQYDDNGEVDTTGTV